MSSSTAEGHEDHQTPTCPLYLDLPSSPHADGWGVHGGVVMAAGFRSTGVSITHRNGPPLSHTFGNSERYGEMNTTAKGNMESAGGEGGVEKHHDLSGKNPCKNQCDSRLLSPRV